MGEREASAAPDTPVSPPQTVSIEEARDTLGELIIRANLRGERFILTRHNKPAAALVSLKDLAALEAVA